jgi:hypothetical protein
MGKTIDRAQARVNRALGDGSVALSHRCIFRPEDLLASSRRTVQEAPRRGPKQSMGTFEGPLGATGRRSCGRLCPRPLNATVPSEMLHRAKCGHVVSRVSIAISHAVAENYTRRTDREILTSRATDNACARFGIASPKRKDSSG